VGYRLQRQRRNARSRGAPILSIPTGTVSLQGIWSQRTRVRGHRV